VHKAEVKRIILERIQELADGDLLDLFEATEVVLGAYGFQKLETGLYCPRGASGPGVSSEDCVEYMARCLTEGV
jgi:hypothetical protein